MKAWMWAFVAAGCGGSNSADPAPAPRNTIGAEAPTKQPVPTAWQSKCLAALEHLREAAAVYEPALRTAEVKLDDVREQVSFSAFPPVWNVPSIHIFVAHEAKPKTTEWQRFNEPMHELSHITWLRTTPTVDAAILLDGWENERARRLEPTLIAGVEPCLL